VFCAADEHAQPPLNPQPLLLQPERVRIAVREGVLDEVARRETAFGGPVEQRPDLGHDGYKTLAQGGAPRSIMGSGSNAGMGRQTHLRTVFGPCLAALLLMLVLGLAAPARAADPTLATRLARALAVPNVDPSRTAALAVDLRTGAVVYSRNAALSLLPASNEKLPIAYAALTLLGTGFRFHTEVVGTGSLVGDVWHGDLFLRGFGDPTLDQADLDGLATDVASWGIRHVDGAVIGDESWFDALRTGPGWKPNFYIDESPPLSALVVGRGWFRSQTSARPALAAASLFRTTLAANGVLVDHPARTGTLTTSGLPLARDVSAPLAEIVRFMGRESDNFTAEVLVKQLGALHAGSGSTGAGARVVRRALAAAGVPLGGVRIADGSGLSRLDRLTATAVVGVLKAGIADPDIRDAFLASLAVAGVDGTLQGRLETRPARGRVIAKTGTTNAACALSGFVRDRFVFAILQNGRPLSSYWARKAQDRFATVLAAS
jgi:serine-type D-Ala-D-Ala carboxypeptidase/endopeptidase (penicillin-binding protein 4)